MKRPYRHLSLIAANVFAVGAAIAGEFINLNFDSPDLSRLQYDPFLRAYYGISSDLVPGWSITQDHLPIDRVWLYNQGTISPATLTLLPPPRDTYILSYSGNTLEPVSQVVKTTQVSQSGMIPFGAIGLEFLWGEVGLIPYNPLRINGTEISISSNPQTPHNYYADVSNWAGQEVTLAFEFRAGASAYLDDLSFVSIPEPSTWALLTVGGLALAWAWRPKSSEPAS